MLLEGICHFIDAINDQGETWRGITSVVLDSKQVKSKQIHFYSQVFK